MTDQPVSDVLDALAVAQTASELSAAHHLLARVVRSSRRHAAAKGGRLASSYVEAMAVLDAQKVAGVPFDVRVRGLEQTLRAAWPPQVREWKLLCQQCEDHGLIISLCPGDATCGDNPQTHRARPPHLLHEFGKPCWCAAGRRFLETPKPSAEDFRAAAKSKPTRIGRR